MSHLFWLFVELAQHSVEWVLIPIQVVVQSWIDYHDIGSE